MHLNERWENCATSKQKPEWSIMASASRFSPTKLKSEVPSSARAWPFKCKFGLFSFQFGDNVLQYDEMLCGFKRESTECCRGHRANEQLWFAWGQGYCASQRHERNRWWIHASRGYRSRFACRNCGSTIAHGLFLQSTANALRSK